MITYSMWKALIQEIKEQKDDEFLKQLESCTENDMVWLKRMAGDDNG